MLNSATVVLLQYLERAYCTCPLQRVKTMRSERSSSTSRQAEASAISPRSAKTQEIGHLGLYLEHKTNDCVIAKKSVRSPQKACTIIINNMYLQGRKAAMRPFDL